MDNTPQEIRDFIRDYEQAKYQFVNAGRELHEKLHPSEPFERRYLHTDEHLFKIDGEKEKREKQFDKTFYADFVRKLYQLSKKHNEKWRIRAIEQYLVTMDKKEAEYE